MVPEL
jgi:hypothetical protein